jgi:hypothetical protein
LKGGASENRESQSTSLPPDPHIENEKAPIGRARGGRADGGSASNPADWTPEKREAWERESRDFREQTLPSLEQERDATAQGEKARGGEIARTPSGGVKASARHKAEREGHTMKGGSFPIRNASDLANAKHDVGRAKDPAAARRWINRRARELGEPPLGA